jgi:hypothetical protein
MALPVTIPNTFATATASIPLSQLDANFNTLANAINGISNGVETLANITVTNAVITLANVTTANVTNLQTANAQVTGGNVSVTTANAAVANLVILQTANAQITGGNVSVDIVSVANGSAANPSIRFTQDTDTGFFNSAANAVSFTEGGSGFRVGYRNIPDGGPKNTSYTLVAADVGKYIQITSGGSITIPDATFANGDVVSMFNNTNAAVTVNCVITTAYIAGTNTDVATANIATRGIATVLFANANVCVITGNVS